jgi:hypothetical protein
VEHVPGIADLSDPRLESHSVKFSLLLMFCAFLRKRDRFHLSAHGQANPILMNVIRTVRDPSDFLSCRPSGT